MQINRIENPNSEDIKPIEDAIMKYSLSQVNAVKPKAWAFHAKEANQIVGGATERVHFSQFYLDNLWVEEKMRLNGYGSKIHEEIVVCAKQQGCNRIQLHTLNEKAVELYKRLGYETLATINGYVDGFNLYYMARKI